MARFVIVRDGEDISQLAQRAGLTPQQLLDHPRNAHIARGGHANVLLPGDEVAIPDAVAKRLRAPSGRTER